MQVSKVLLCHAHQLSGAVGILPALGQRLDQPKLPGNGLLTSANGLFRFSYRRVVEL